MKFLRVVFLLIASVIVAEGIGETFLRRIYASSNFYNTGNNRNIGKVNFETTRRTTKARGRSYKEICRAVNPAPYSFPNKIPFPSVPIC